MVRLPDQCVISLFNCTIHTARVISSSMIHVQYNVCDIGLSYTQDCLHQEIYEERMEAS